MGSAHRDGWLKAISACTRLRISTGLRPRGDWSSGQHPFILLPLQQWSTHMLSRWPGDGYCHLNCNVNSYDSYSKADLRSVRLSSWETLVLSSFQDCIDPCLSMASEQRRLCLRVCTPLCLSKVKLVGCLTKQGEKENITWYQKENADTIHSDKPPLFLAVWDSLYVFIS